MEIQARGENRGAGLKSQFLGEKKRKRKKEIQPNHIDAALVEKKGSRASIFLCGHE